MERIVFLQQRYLYVDFARAKRSICETSSPTLNAFALKQCALVLQFCILGAFGK
jgi:hypothetical protein